MIMSRFFVDLFSHGTEELRRRTLLCSVLCFRKFPEAKKFLDKNEGGCQDFPSNVFCINLPKDFIEEPFSVSII